MAIGLAAIAAGTATMNAIKQARSQIVRKLLGKPILIAVSANDMTIDIRAAITVTNRFGRYLADNFMMLVTSGAII